jgi:ureidoacrylate peracid hydrolase
MWRVSGRDYFRIVPKKCALLVIDMQNSFVEKEAVFEAAKGRDIIPNINRLVVYAREHGMPIIWTQSQHSAPGGGLLLERYPVIKHTRELWAGDHSFELYKDMVQPEASDVRIIKPKQDAFHDTNLDSIIKNLGKDTVIITGIATEVCCACTARGAFHREYKVIFLRDATAASDPSLHDSTCDHMDQLYARTLRTEELIGIIDRGGET